MIAAALAIASVTSAAAGTNSSATAASSSVATSSSTPAGSTSAAASAKQPWTGYVLVGHEVGFRQVTADFKIPVVSCTASGSKASFWIGLDGYNNGTIEQVGISTNCDNVPEYTAWFQMWPSTINYQFLVHPGDSIAMSVAYVSGHWALALKDLTDGQKFNVSEKCPSGKVCENMTAEAILEAASGSNLSSFNTTGFTEFQAVDSTGAKTGLVANGDLWGLAKVLMTGTNGQPLADLSTITDSGENFSFVYKQAT